MENVYKIKHKNKQKKSKWDKTYKRGNLTFGSDPEKSIEIFNQISQSKGSPQSGYDCISNNSASITSVACGESLNEDKNNNNIEKLVSKLSLKEGKYYSTISETVNKKIPTSKEKEYEKAKIELEAKSIAKGFGVWTEDSPVEDTYLVESSSVDYLLDLSSRLLQMGCVIFSVSSNKLIVLGYDWNENTSSYDLTQKGNKVITENECSIEGTGGYTEINNFRFSFNIWDNKDKEIFKKLNEVFVSDYAQMYIDRFMDDYNKGIISLDELKSKLKDYMLWNSDNQINKYIKAHSTKNESLNEVKEINRDDLIYGYHISEYDDGPSIAQITKNRPYDDADYYWATLRNDGWHIVFDGKTVNIMPANSRPNKVASRLAELNKDIKAEIITDSLEKEYDLDISDVNAYNNIIDESYKDENIELKEDYKSAKDWAEQALIDFNTLRDDLYAIESEISSENESIARDASRTIDRLEDNVLDNLSDIFDELSELDN